MATRKRATRKKVISGLITKTGIEVTECYCRKCMQTKPAAQFYQAVDTYVDANGLFSVCKTCLAEVYTLLLDTEKTMDRIILRMCRMFNVRYMPEVVEACRKHLDTLERNGKTKGYSNPFGLYRSKMRTTQSSAPGARFEEDFTYRDVTIGETITLEPKNNLLVDKDLKQFWGNNFDEEDYDWLENEMWEWKKTHKIDTRSEEHLLRLIVLKLFDIRKARQEERDTSSLEKSLQDMLKTANLAPNQSNAASGGKSLDTFGMWIKDIEQFTPAEWVKDKSIFFDVDNVEEYAEKFITSPLRSFVTGQRDFFLEDEDDAIITDDGIDDEE